MPDARPTTLPRDLLARDADELQATESEEAFVCRHPLSAVEEVKHYSTNSTMRTATAQEPRDVARPTMSARVPPPLLLVKVAADSAASATSPTQSAAKAEADNATAEVHASPPLSANTADKNPCDPGTETATDAEATVKPSATPDAATSPARRIYHCCCRSQPVADEDARAAADVVVIKDLLPRLMVSTTAGPSAPTRSPNKDRERNQ
ncbi:hypothetical protein AAVH_28450 [Aphelenchoides avenae]|nr:hypothetical protein AAVH_28450 [Aphelenchus avenae]